MLEGKKFLAGACRENAMMVLTVDPFGLFIFFFSGNRVSAGSGNQDDCDEDKHPGEHRRKGG